MALNYSSGYYSVHHPEDGWQDDSYSDNSEDTAFLLERQFFGHDLRRLNDIENALPYTSSYPDYSVYQQPMVTSYTTHWLPEDNRFFGRYAYDQPPIYHYASYCAYMLTQPSIVYSASPMYKSKSFEIDGSGGFDTRDRFETKFIISYSNLEFNEPEFEEYDPTPYGGGYDPSTTYGKALPPSDEICYPRDSAKLVDPQVQPQGGIAAIAVLDAIDTGKVIDLEPEPEEEEEQEEEPEPQPISKPEEPKPLVMVEAVKIQEQPIIGEQEEPKLQPLSAVTNNQMFPPAPPGFGLDALDLCESLFGYWPCLARDARRGQQYYYCPSGHDNSRCCIHRNNEWEGAAEYLFGSHDPYNGNIYGGRYGHEYDGFTYQSSPSLFAQEKHCEDREVRYVPAEYSYMKWIDG